MLLFTLLLLSLGAALTFRVFERPGALLLLVLLCVLLPMRALAGVQEVVTDPAVLVPGIIIFAVACVAAGLYLGRLSLARTKVLLEVARLAATHTETTLDDELIAFINEQLRLRGASPLKTQEWPLVQEAVGTLRA